MQHMQQESWTNWISVPLWRTVLQLAPLLGHARVHVQLQRARAGRHTQKQSSNRRREN